MNVNLAELAKEIHEAAVEKGFWDVENAHIKHIAKMHSELSEAVQADRAGVMYEIEHDGAKPEGVVAELADFVMMLLDLIAEFGAVLPEGSPHEWLTKPVEESELLEFDLPTMVCALHSELCDAMYNAGQAHIMLVMPYMWLRARGYDLWQIIRKKMAYNKKNRGYLHGRAY